MKASKELVNEINNTLQILQDEGLRIRNDLVILSNNYEAKADVIVKQKRTLFKNVVAKGLIKIKTEKVMKAHGTWGFVCSALSVLSLAGAVLISPAFYGVASALFVTISAYNIYKYIECKKSLSEIKDELNKMSKENEYIKSKSAELEDDYLPKLQELTEKLKRVGHKFFELKKYKEEMVQTIKTSQDKSFVDDKADKLNFELAMLL